MKDLILKNKLLVILIVLYFVAGLSVLIAFDKGEFELLVNRHHDPYLDVFFFYITYLGDGWGSALILVLVFLRRIYYGLLALISLLVSAVIVQSMKRLIFAEYPRPSKFFEKQIDLHFIDGLELHSYFSFPSGHSSGAFSVFIILALIAQNKIYAVFYFLLALLAAFSRVYLMQHFFIDTYFGAGIGIIVAILVYYYIDYRSSLPENTIVQRPLLKIFEKK